MNCLDDLGPTYGVSVQLGDADTRAFYHYEQLPSLIQTLCAIGTSAPLDVLALEKSPVVRALRAAGLMFDAQPPRRYAEIYVLEHCARLAMSSPCQGLTFEYNLSAPSSLAELSECISAFTGVEHILLITKPEEFFIEHIMASLPRSISVSPSVKELRWSLTLNDEPDAWAVCKTWGVFRQRSTFSKTEAGRNELLKVLRSHGPWDLMAFANQRVLPFDEVQQDVVHWSAT